MLSVSNIYSLHRALSSLTHGLDRLVIPLGHFPRNETLFILPHPGFRPCSLHASGQPSSSVHFVSYQTSGGTYTSRQAEEDE